MTNWMDRWLRVALEERATGTLPLPCLDAETAAAFVDDTLPADERSRAEAHAADCARCQALLAALVTVTPAAAPRAWWRRPAIVWLVPAAVAVSAVVVWVNMPRGPELEPPTELVSRAAQPPAAPPATAVQPPPQEHDRPSPTLPPPAPGQADLHARNSMAAPIPAPQSQAAAEARRADAPLPSAVLSQATSTPQAAPAVGADARQSAPAEEAAEVSIAESATITEMSERALTGRLEAVRGTVFVSSNPISRWRLGAAGTVHHSADGGTTWQTRDTGVDVTLTAGASPSLAVCWVVGPHGTVLISTDEGRSWQRVPFPATSDLVSVHATDARTATVTTAEGRTFTTTDRGRTWK